MKTLSAKIELFTDLGEKQADYKGYAPVNYSLKITKRKIFNNEDIIFPQCVGGKNKIDFIKVTFSNGISYCSMLPREVVVEPSISPVFLKGNLIIKEYQYV